MYKVTHSRVTQTPCAMRRHPPCCFFYKFSEMFHNIIQENRLISHAPFRENNRNTTFLFSGAILGIQSLVRYLLTQVKEYLLRYHKKNVWHMFWEYLYFSFPQRTYELSFSFFTNCYQCFKLIWSIKFWLSCQVIAWIPLYGGNVFRKSSDKYKPTTTFDWHSFLEFTTWSPHYGCI